MRFHRQTRRQLINIQRWIYNLPLTSLVNLIKEVFHRLNSFPSIMSATFSTTPIMADIMNHIWMIPIFPCRGAASPAKPSVIFPSENGNQPSLQIFNKRHRYSLCILCRRFVIPFLTFHPVGWNGWKLSFRCPLKRTCRKRRPFFLGKILQSLLKWVNIINSRSSSNFVGKKFFSGLSFF